MLIRLVLAPPPPSLDHDDGDANEQPAEHTNKKFVYAVMTADGYNVILRVTDATHWLESTWQHHRARCETTLQNFFPILLKGIRAQYPDAVVMVETAEYGQAYARELSSQLYNMYPPTDIPNRDYGIDTATNRVRERLAGEWSAFLERFGFQRPREWAQHHFLIPTTILRWINDPFPAIGAAVPFDDPENVAPFHHVGLDGQSDAVCVGRGDQHQTMLAARSQFGLALQGGGRATAGWQPQSPQQPGGSRSPAVGGTARLLGLGHRREPMIRHRGEVNSPMLLQFGNPWEIGTSVMPCDRRREGGTTDNHVEGHGEMVVAEGLRPWAFMFAQTL